MRSFIPTCLIILLSFFVTTPAHCLQVRELQWQLSPNEVAKDCAVGVKPMLTLTSLEYFPANSHIFQYVIGMIATAFLLLVLPVTTPLVPLSKLSPTCSIWSFPATHYSITVTMRLLSQQRPH